MSDPTARAIRLLALLQRRGFWRGADLARELEVSERTLGRDVDRLRRLGYRVEADPGVAGGYRLDAGASLPPLVLDDEEAVALALGLTSATTWGVEGAEDVFVGLLARLGQTLPSRLRERVTAIDSQTSVSPGPVRHASSEALSLLALLCRDAERVRFHYVDRSGAGSTRRVEPRSLSTDSCRWLLVGWDLDREAWRTFRVDRLHDIARTGIRFSPRALPAADGADYVRAAEAAMRSTFAATIHLDASIDQVREQLGEWASTAQEQSDGSVVWPISGASIPELLMALAWIPPDVRWTMSTTSDVSAHVAAFRERIAEALTTAAERRESR